MDFKDLGLDPRLEQGISDRGYTELTDVQEMTLDLTLHDLDVAVQSQTGTGKTAAFLITLFDRLLRWRGRGRKKALVVVPTRELAVQIEKEAKLLNQHLGFSIGCFYGGVGYGNQLDLLKNGVDILIGTPGRLLDLGDRGDIDLTQISFLVIDEADRLLDMGFLPDIRRLLAGMPPPQKRQSMLFSATLTHDARKVAADFLNRPEYIEVTPEQVTVETITQELYEVPGHLKVNLLLGLFQRYSPQTALIFTNTRHAAEFVARDLKHNGIDARHLTGDLPQRKRLAVIHDFKAAEFAVLVAADVAARGLHIDDLDMVVNYDVPQDIESYVHRIGRTARAGKTGRAITLASEGTTYQVQSIENFIGMKIPVKAASEDLFLTDRSLEHRPRGTDRRRRADGGKPRARGSSDRKRRPRRDKPRGGRGGRRGPGR